MEQLQVHSKSYIVRWINVGSGYSISWTLQPHKKSLKFGIFKHPGTKNGTSPNLPTTTTFESPITHGIEAEDEARPRRGSTNKNDSTTVVEKLQSIGIKCVAWTGKCEADKVSMGKYDVPEGEGGMYGLVFDNTFSRQVSKTATFVLMTHPTSATPKSGAQLHYSQAQAAGSGTSVGRPSPSGRAVSESSDAISHDAPTITPTLKVPKQTHGASPDSSFFTGVLYKKRRKRNQGWARRFFSLDFASSTLSYYRNNHSSAIRGAVPLSLAAIGVNDKNKEFSIDSGAEVWHLRVRMKKDFEAWKRALEHASNTFVPSPSPATPLLSQSSLGSSSTVDAAAEREWARVEELITKVSASRDAARRIAQDTDPKYGTTNGNGSVRGVSPSPVSSESNPFFRDDDRPAERIPFWKRKPSSSSTGGSPAGMFRRSVSAQVPTSTTNLAPNSISPPLPVQIPRSRSPAPSFRETDDVHERCMALLRDLDNTVTEFSALLAESKARRMPPLQTSKSRMSIDSTTSEDYFDAEEGSNSPSQLLCIRDSDDIHDDKDEFLTDDESETSSDPGERGAAFGGDDISSEPHSLLFPARPKVLMPTTVAQADRRVTVPPPKQPPPSIIGFLRKNAGKDLSTVAMPVSANEPTSLLQRLAEPLESASLLTKASLLAGPDHAAERLLYVAAFAVSGFSSSRVKERAIRKPFNPMLGETYELLGHEAASVDSPAYRFVAEKVCHHPVRMAWQADSLAGYWSVSQSPEPIQKFWGKSVELNTEGKWRLVLYPSQTPSLSKNESAEGAHIAGERYSWTQAPAFLRNVLAGEKYVEPTHSMTIVNESTGHSAVASFKAAGMFSGRSEDVTIALYNPGTNTPLPLGGAGKWTTGLTRTDNGESIWSPGPLVPDAPKVYGFTTFAAGLNDLGVVERGKIPVTDSRLRHDQRALESGELDNAEALKARLEERQRSRRKVLESHGGVWKPRFFEKVEEGAGGAGAGAGAGDEEEVWRLRIGKEGYWECRERGEWKDVPAVFEV